MKKLLLIPLISITMISCKEYLDARPDKKLAVPSSLADLNALLDNSAMNTYSLLGEVAADNLYHTEAIWNSIVNERDRDTYTWENDRFDGDGGNMSARYKIIFNANVVLEVIERITPKSFEQEEWKRIKGAASFFRAYAYLELVQLYAKPYSHEIAASTAGIPLRLSPDVNVKAGRGTLAGTYDRILLDLKQAIALLPVQTSIPTRPNKVAAYGVMARVFLNRHDYEQAGLYADSVLQLQNELLDYSLVSSTATIPFSRFNKEVIFHSFGSSANITLARARVDSTLYDSYHNRDRRKVLFFRKNTDNKSYAFQGSYEGGTGSCFLGITTAEMYLTRAECFARAGQTGKAMDDLNTLLEMRWEKDFFEPLIAVDASDALSQVLTERRKELLFRGMRWNDLRRLNQEPAFAVTLQRKLGAANYVLPPKDKRYVFPIPENIEQLSGIAQNDR